MAVLQAKKLKAALEKAQKVGLVEESVTVAGCHLVLSSLPPGAYESIQEEIKELDDVAYLHAFQLGHLCRAIVELEGTDLRDVDFIEEEEGGKPVKLEKHAWLRDHVLRTWSRESIHALWRKVQEVFAKADDVAKEGIVFNIAEETDEEKFRRLLDEMRSTAGDLPDTLVLKILDENGFMLKSTREQLDNAAEKLAQIQETPAATESPTPVATSSVDELMKNRVPMNQGSVEVPATPQPQAPVVSSSVRRAEVPPAIREAAVSTQSLSRAAQIANLEGLSPTELVNPPPPQRPDVVDLKPSGSYDPSSVSIDRPPVRGINPRFQPPRRP